LATTALERSEPPIIAPAGANGDAVPKSTTNPMSFPVLFHSTVVPAFTQKRELLFAPGMSGVDEAALEVRFTSTPQEVDVEPQVLAALHNCAAFASLHAKALLFDCAGAKADNTRSGKISEVILLPKPLYIVIVSPHKVVEIMAAHVDDLA
jgi:hypothetical protein